MIAKGIGLAQARKRESTHELEGCLYTLHAVLVPDSCKLRLAIHVPVGESLEQVSEYVGDTPKPPCRPAVSQQPG